MSWLPSQAIFEVKPISSGGWGNSWPTVAETKPVWAGDEDKKKLFGVELAKESLNPFQAACKIFPETADALWASRNWLTDPIVIGAKDAYRQIIDTNISLIGKDQFQVQLLKIASEKNPLNDKFYLAETKDRLKALELYAEIQGWIKNKSLIDASTNNFLNNEMKITFVEPEPKEQPKTIEHQKQEIVSDDDLPFKLVACE